MFSRFKKFFSHFIIVYGFKTAPEPHVLFGPGTFIIIIHKGCQPACQSIILESQEQFIILIAYISEYLFIYQRNSINPILIIFVYIYREINKLF